MDKRRGYMKCRFFYHIRVDNAYILYSLQFKSLFKELHKSVIISDKQNQIGVLTYILIKPFDRNKWLYIVTSPDSLYQVKVTWLCVCVYSDNDHNTMLTTVSLYVTFLPYFNSILTLRNAFINCEFLKCFRKMFTLCYSS